jgi:uncharacterized membrane protein
MADKTNKTVVVYVATYTSLDDAKADYGAVKQLHSAGIIGTYDAAVISKDAAGKVKIIKTEKPTEHGAWAGLAVGALVGLFFPPYLLWETAVGAGAGAAIGAGTGGAIGAGAGALIGHFWAGMSRSDLKEIGDTLQASMAALIVIGRSRLQEALRDATQHAVKQFEKELSTDVDAFNKDLTEAINQSLKGA